jgi:hypothetical protein
MLAADLHRRGAKAVLREHASHAGTFVQQKHGEVLAVGLADAGLGTPIRTPAMGCRSAATGARRLTGMGCLSKNCGRLSAKPRAQMKTRAEARVVWCYCIRPACRGTACIFCRCRRGRVVAPHAHALKWHGPLSGVHRGLHSPVSVGAV